MRIHRLQRIFAYLLTIIMLTGCSIFNRTPPLDPKSPAVITLWHYYNGKTKTALDQLISEFNDTIGLDLGIIVDAYSFGEVDELDDAIFNAANNKIGAEPLPNIFLAYPDNAYRISQMVNLVELTTYFSENELAEFKSEFLKEGILTEGGNPIILPIVKSMEIIYINKTDWEVFSNETGITLQTFNTWEGISAAAKEYYQWSGGSSLLGINPYNNYMFTTAVQLGSPVFETSNHEVQFEYSIETAKKVWDNLYIPHINGWFSSGSYLSDGVKSGKIIAYIGSSAGATYFPLKVTKNAEQSYPIDCITLPYPTFRGAKSVVGQRGAGMSIIATDKEHDYASAQFLKWLTQNKQNMQFADLTGYLPVKTDSLNTIEDTLNSPDTQPVTKSISTVLEMIYDYELQLMPPFPNSYDIKHIFEQSIFDKITSDLELLCYRMEGSEDKGSIITELTSEHSFEAWYHELILQIEQYLEKIKRESEAID